MYQDCTCKGQITSEISCRWKGMNWPNYLFRLRDSVTKQVINHRSKELEFDEVLIV